jgi:hypothetical protein
VVLTTMVFLPLGGLTAISAPVRRVCLIMAQPNTAGAGV